MSYFCIDKTTSSLRWNTASDRARETEIRRVYRPGERRIGGLSHQYVMNKLRAHQSNLPPRTHMNL